MKFTVGISPFPNDTFIFDAMYHRLIDTHGLSFKFIFEDVETLNKLAQQRKLDMVKISYANYFSVLDNYIMLRSGSALGNGVGPLLIAKKDFSIQEISNLSIAIPGIHTTANFLLSFAFLESEKRTALPFSVIEDKVLDGEFEAGVIIHENRFTYQDKGLIKLLDLGEYWEQKTNLPIPLGGIAIRRNLSEDMQSQINFLMQSSISYSRKSYPVLSQFVKNHAQEMDEAVMLKHIDLYVNENTFEISANGIDAVAKMGSILHQNSSLPLFVKTN